MPQSSPSVLIIRLDGIGDALALTPLLAALRDAGTTVDLVLREPNRNVFAVSAVQSVEIAPFRLRDSSRENARRVDAFGEMLAARAYATALVATEDPSGYQLARRTGAARRVGFVNGWGKPFKTIWAHSMLTDAVYRPAGLGRSTRHECETLFELGTSLVPETAPTHDLQRLRPLVLESDVHRSAGIVVQVTSKWERIGIHASDIATLLRELAETHPVRAIASREEAAFANAISSLAKVNVERFSQIEPWKEVIASARALVAPDSGATHVAGMTGTPTVAVFPQREFARQVTRWHPWAAPYRALTASSEWRQRTHRALDELTSSDRA